MNKELLKEWDKIKNYDIFESIEEFEKIFNEKPYGICMRKYTAYPWNKDNFFFGSSQELNDWYRTTDEIPFFAKDYINKKYGHLTIIEFGRDKDNLQNSLVVKCKCDCGNIVVFEWRKVRHGDLSSCGCKSRKEKKISNLYDAFTKIVEERWDYEKNQISPKEVPYDSEELYWWKGYDNSYLMAPKSLLNKSTGTSFPEQAILFYLKKITNNVLNRYKLSIDSKKYEVDIFLPKYKIAIEYDGFIWHKDKIEEDIAKSKALISSGIKLIRIRESRLVNFLENDISIIHSDIENKTYLQSICDSINAATSLLYSITKSKCFNVNKIDIETLKKDKIEIEKNYLKQYENNSIANTWLSKIWSNANKIENYKISNLSNDQFYFTCNKKRKILISPKTIYTLYKNLSSNKKKIFENTLLIDNKCPFVDMKECPCNALFNKKISTTCSFQKNNINSERLIYSYDKEESIYTPNSFYKNSEFVNLSSIPVKKELDKLNQFLSSFPDFYSNNLSQKLCNLLKNVLYYNLDVENEAFDSFFKVNMNDSVRQKYIEDMFFECINDTELTLKICSCRKVLSFYFNNIEYEKVLKNNKYLIFNESRDCFFMKVIVSLFNEKDFEGLYIAVNILSNLLKNSDYEFIIKNVVILNSVKPTKIYRKMMESQKRKRDLINLLTFNCFPQVQNEIREIIDMKASQVRIKYVSEFIENKIVDKSITRSEIENLYHKYTWSESSEFFYKINHFLDKYKDNDLLNQIFETERKFVEKYKEEKYITGFMSVGYFDKKYVPTLLMDYDIEKENEIFCEIKNYLSFFKGLYIDIHIEELSNVDMVYELLKEYGLYNVYFDIKLFDNNEYIDNFFDYIEEYYDDNSLPTVNNEKFVEPIWNLIKLNLLSQEFIDRAKKTLTYIQRCDRKSNHFVMASINDDFNKLMGIDRKKIQKRFYKENP